MSYVFYLLTPPESDGQPASLWRSHRAGLFRTERWEYLSLLDWQWHSALAEPPHLQCISTEDALTQEAERVGLARYWARYIDRESWAAGAPPVTVVRRRDSPERCYDESFRSWGGWAPTQLCYDLAEQRSSTTAYLVEIDAVSADRILAENFGVTNATRLFDTEVRPPELTAAEIDSVQEYWNRASDTASEVAVELDAMVDTLGTTHVAHRAERYAIVKSLEALQQQVAVLRSEGIPLSAALHSINDIVRFTVVFELDSYADSVHRIFDLMEQKGYALLPDSVVNSWENSASPDFRAVWASPMEPDLHIEIQFHTEESLWLRDANEHLHDFHRQTELWPNRSSSGAVAFVQESSWWAVRETPAYGQAIAGLLGYDSFDEALRDVTSAPKRLAVLLDEFLCSGATHATLLLRRLIWIVADASELPDATQEDEVEELVVAIAQWALPEGDELSEVALGFFLSLDADEAEDELFDLCCRTARLLIGAAVIARGDVDTHSDVHSHLAPPATAPAATTNVTVLTSILGLPDEQTLRTNPDLVAYRLAYLLDIPVRNPTALAVLGGILDDFAEGTRQSVHLITQLFPESDDEPSDDDDVLNFETYRAAAAGFGVPEDHLDGHVYEICLRAMSFLAHAELIRTFD